MKYFVNALGQLDAHTQPGQATAILRWMVWDVGFLNAEPLTETQNQHSKSQVAGQTPDSKEGYSRIPTHINTIRT